MATWKKVIVSGSNISQLNNDSGFLASAGGGILSSSAQISADISGSSTSLSSSIASRVTTEEVNVDLLQAHQGNILAETGSQYAHISNLNAATGSQYAHIANLNTFTGSAARRTAITGSSTALSSSLATRVTAQEVFSASLDDSFVTEAELNTATSSVSSSLAADIATNLSNNTALDGEVTNLMAATGSQFAHIANLNTFTGSAGRRSAISGSITSFSSSIASRVTTEEGNVDVAQAHIGNIHAFTASADGEITALMGATGSYALEANISGSFTATSASIASDIATNTNNATALDGEVTNLMAATGSQYAHIANLNTFTGSAARRSAITGSSTALSSSVASRLQTVEGSVGAGGLLSSSAQIATDISGSSTALSSSIAGRVTTNETEIDSLQAFSQSVDTAFNFSGADVTVSGNLTVAGTTTTVDSTTVDIGDNIIALNGTGATKGGLAVNDGPASGSLLWDGTNDYWVAGPTGSEIKILLEEGDGILSSSAQIAANISGSSTSLSSSVASRITTTDATATALDGEVTNIMAATGSQFTHIANLNTFTGSAGRRSAISGSFTATSASIASDIANITSTFDIDADTGTADTVTTGETLTFTGAGPITTAVSDNTITFDVNDTTISGSTTALSSSIATRITTAETTATALDGEVTNLMAATGSQYAHIGNLNTKTGSIETDVTALESFSSSLSSTVISYTGSFTGDGSGLTDITVSQNSTVESSFTSATTASVTHNFGSKNVIVSVYDDNDEQIIPATVRLTSDNALEVHIASSTTGKVIVARGGHIVSGSIPFGNLLEVPALLSSSAQIGTEISGSFTATSASIASDIASISTTFTIDADTGTSNALDSGETLTFTGAGPITTAVSANTITLDVTDSVISGSFTALSSSIASRVTTEENNVDVAQAHIGNIHSFTSSADGEITALMDFTGSAGRRSAISGSFTATSASIASDIASISTTFSIDGDTGTANDIDSGETLTIAGTSNEIATVVSANTITIGLPNDVTIGGALTVTGDLTVTGNTIEQQVTNLNVEDQFILLNSGSAAQDAGFVVNGQGAALGWDESENRFALDFAGATWNQTSITSDAFVAAVVTSDNSNYQKVGNIRVDGDDIYIYS